MIFEAAYGLHSRGEPVDPVTVAEELRRAGQLDALGGRQTLLRIQAATPASANAQHYAQIVSELAMLRRLIGTAGDIQEMAYTARTTSTRRSTAPRPLIFEVAERRVADTLMQLHPALEQTMDQLEALYDRDTAIIVGARPAITTSTSCCSGCSRRRSRSSPPVPVRARRRSRSVRR